MQFVYLISIYLTIAFNNFEAGNPVEATTEKLPGIAVVELFTSEGCSSCPPADAFLTDLQEVAAQEGVNIYPLAFHIDYWNRLGWIDAFSKKEFTQRQYTYARSLQLSTVYTPQMVINGVAERVGSRRKEITTLIEKALAAPATVKIKVKLHEQKADKWQVVVSTQGIDSKALVQICLVEDEIYKKIGAGENGGRMLRHDRVVRNIHTINTHEDLKDEHVYFELPPNFVKENGDVVAFVQIPSLEIIGASSIK